MPSVGQTRVVVGIHRAGASRRRDVRSQRAARRASHDIAAVFDSGAVVAGVRHRVAAVVAENQEGGRSGLAKTADEAIGDCAPARRFRSGFSAMKCSARRSPAWRPPRSSRNNSASASVPGDRQHRARAPGTASIERLSSDRQASEAGRDHRGDRRLTISTICLASRPTP